jgi:hypothetical protein
MAYRAVLQHQTTMSTVGTLASCANLSCPQTVTIWGAPPVKVFCNSCSSQPLWWFKMCHYGHVRTQDHRMVCDDCNSTTLSQTATPSMPAAPRSLAPMPTTQPAIVYKDPRSRKADTSHCYNLYCGSEITQNYISTRPGLCADCATGQNLKMKYDQSHTGWLMCGYCEKPTPASHAGACKAHKAWTKDW